VAIFKHPLPPPQSQPANNNTPSPHSRTLPSTLPPATALSPSLLPAAFPPFLPLRRCPLLLRRPNPPSHLPTPLCRRPFPQDPDPARGAARRKGRVFLSAVVSPPLLPLCSPSLLCLVNDSARPSGASLITVTVATRGPILSSSATSPCLLCPGAAGGGCRSA
jgi:hypothetical protein